MDHINMLKYLIGKISRGALLYTNKHLNKVRRVYIKLNYPTVFFSKNTSIGKNTTIRATDKAKIIFNNGFLSKDTYIVAKRGGAYNRF